MNFYLLAESYNIALNMSDKNAAYHEINKVLREAASNFPKDKPEQLALFTAALQEPDKKWFVAKLMGKISPVPKSLLDDLVLAAMMEPNPSANKFYIIPCVKTFGAKLVREVMVKYTSHPRVLECNGYEQTEYWVKCASA